jgi:hypothetical protein
MGKLVLVLVPALELEWQVQIALARGGCASAMERGLEPMSPVLHYGAIVPQSELGGAWMVARARWWHRRACAVWVCLPPNVPDVEDLELDVVSYYVLFHNEHVVCRGSDGYVPRAARDKLRKPVSLVQWKEDNIEVSPVPREEISYLLRTNVVPGLLKGGLL